MRGQLEETLGEPIQSEIPLADYKWANWLRKNR